MSQSPRLAVKSKIWIEDGNGQVVFGAGRLHILQAIARNGSINAAATELQMSYRAVWGKIRATEKRMGKDLLHRKTGGVQGGGSILTSFALEMIKRFNKLQTLTCDAADELFLGLSISDMEEK